MSPRLEIFEYKSKSNGNKIYETVLLVLFLYFSFNTFMKDLENRKPYNFFQKKEESHTIEMIWEWKPVIILGCGS